jgi:diguanylate cyclase (GGDEF)-like protein/PAS domain S-box-containing protein
VSIAATLSAGLASDALALATLFTAIAIVVLGGAVLARGRGSLLSSLFFLITLGASGWLALDAATFVAGNAALALDLARASLASASVVPAAIFHFAAVYTKRAPKLAPLIVACWLFCAAVAAGALFTSLIIPDVHQYSWGFYGRTPPVDLIWMAAFAAMFAASIALIARRIRDDDPLARAGARALLVACIAGFFAAVNMIPAFGIGIYPLGFVALLAFVGLSANAIWRYGLVQLTPQFAAEQVLGTMKGAVLVVDLEAKIRVANRAACAMLGFPEDSLVGKPLKNIVEADVSTGKLLHSMGVLEQNMVWRAADGTKIDVAASSSFLRDPEGLPVGVVYVASDVTERRRAEQAMRESEHRYRTLFDGNPLPMWIYDFETLHFLAVNEAATRTYGYSKEEFLRMRITDIRPAEDLPAMHARLAELRDRSAPRLFRHRKKDGSTFYADVTSYEFVTAGRRARLVISVDVTERQRAEQLLRESEERYRSLVELSPDAIMLHADRRFIFLNRAAVELLGAESADDLIGTPVIERVHPDSRPIVSARLHTLDEGEDVPMVEEKFLRLDGSVVEVQVAAIGFLFNGRPAVQVVARDVSERKEIEERYRLLFERNLAGVFRTTIDGRILDCNDALARIFGYRDKNELLQQQAQSVYFERNDREAILESLREHGSLTNVETRMRRADGREIWVLENVTLLESRGELEGTIIDITERKTAQEQIEYQAFHDVVTGLPNRRLFRDRIGVALAHARRQRRGIAVMFLDLDQFKLVNDTLGHTVGDALLQAVANRLVGCVRAEDTVARMGGDEFTVLVSDTNDRRAAGIVAQKVLETVAQPITVEGHELFVTTSLGIAMFPDDGTDAETLLKNADRAMYRAKEAGRNNFQYSTPAAFDEAAGRLSIEASLHHALEREELVVHYQPIIDLGSREIVGAEALVRWRHPEHGLMGPDDFIHIAEECGLIVPMGEWILRTSCAQMKQWHDDGHGRLRIAVNLSPRQFQQRELPAMIERVLHETGLDPSLLDIEITESAAMQNAEQSLAIMRKLKEMGVRISIDDFGTGYSSLSYLKRFPIDTVKIDQNFVRDLAVSPNDAAIVTAVISMARALKLSVIAEGVETEEQLNFLEREQCETVQGFLYSRPVPAEEFSAALAAVRA